MKWFYNLKISAKLLISFIVVTVLTGFIGYMGISNMGKINGMLNNMYSNNLVPISDIANANMQLVYHNRELYNYTLKTEKSEMDEIKAKMDTYEEKMKEMLQKYKTTDLSDEEKSLLSKFDENWASYKNSVNKVLPLSYEGRNQEAVSLLDSEAAKTFQTADDTLSQLVDVNKDLSKNAYEESDSIYNQSLTFMLVLIGICVLAGIALALFISMIISKPIKKLVEAADKLAVGDVNANVEATTKDEIGNLMQSFSKMIDNIREQAFAAEKMAAGDLTVQVKVKSENDLLGKKLSEMIEMNNEILTNISSAAGQVAAGARQVSMSSQALSQGSTEQASSIEETTSSMTEVAAQTKQNATNANQANELALAAKENAEQGNRQMQDMVKAMAEINDSSANISKIIKVIDEIAFQTNILALNAAVEAARAGQHGKGFAVVAEEVRNLAARSANAAKETTEMIEGSIKKVEIGTKIANETAEALDKIVNGVTKAADLVGDIAIASNEQATGISQVNQAISQVAQVVQTNSATAEESASASEELSSQANLLKDSVSRFKLKKAKGPHGLDNVLSSDVIRMIEDVVDKKKSHGHANLNSTEDEEAYAQNSSPKTKIALDDKDFGKY